MGVAEQARGVQHGLADDRLIPLVQTSLGGRRRLLSLWWYHRAHVAKECERILVCVDPLTFPLTFLLTFPLTFPLNRELLLFSRRRCGLHCLAHRGEVESGPLLVLSVGPLILTFLAQPSLTFHLP